MLVGSGDIVELETNGSSIDQGFRLDIGASGSRVGPGVRLHCSAEEQAKSVDDQLFHKGDDYDHKRPIWVPNCKYLIIIDLHIVNAIKPSLNGNGQSLKQKWLSID